MDGNMVGGCDGLQLGARDGLMDGNMVGGCDGL